MDTYPLEHGHGLWLTGSLCRLFGLPLDPAPAERQLPPPWTLATLRGVLAELGLKSGYVTPKSRLQGLQSVFYCQPPAHSHRPRR